MVKKDHIKCCFSVEMSFCEFEVIILVITEGYSRLFHFCLMLHCLQLLQGCRYLVETILVLEILCNLCIMNPGILSLSIWRFFFFFESSDLYIQKIFWKFQIRNHPHFLSFKNINDGFDHPLLMGNHQLNFIECCMLIVTSDRTWVVTNMIQ